MSNNCIHVCMKMNKTDSETFETLLDDDNGDFSMNKAFLACHCVYDFYGSDCCVKNRFGRN